MDALLKNWNLHFKSAAPLSSGLIHRSWKVEAEEGTYVLQALNTEVFPDPGMTGRNLRRLQAFLDREGRSYPLVRPMEAGEGGDAVPFEGAVYRLTPFVAGARTVEVATTPEQAFAAAAAFAAFAAAFDGFPVAELEVPLPGFHDLEGRYAQFRGAVERDSAGRLARCLREVAVLEEYNGLVKRYGAVRQSAGWPLRVVHHDTKISNVLFDGQGRVLTVIDLDTVMPGYYISDLGDAVRTYVSPVSEEEGDVSNVRVRKEFLAALGEGYLSVMGPLLTPEEREGVSFAGPFAVCMQALRFLTDHLNGDPYYGARYPDHNLYRARNQLALLGQIVAQS